MAQTVEAFGWAARDTSGVLSPFSFHRRATGDNDVQIKVLYCGVCDWDLWVVKNFLGTTKYPVLPGHEVVGVVTEVGRKVQKFKVGDKVGMGGYIAACRKCKRCTDGLENYCRGVVTADGTSFGDGSHPCGQNADGTKTKIYGGYSDITVADENFVVLWPESYAVDAGAPLLCGGLTTYSAMKNFGFSKPGVHVGVVGFGGIGRLSVKFLKAFGAKVTVISTSTDKKREAIEAYGADSFVLSLDPKEMEDAADTLDGILDTVPEVHSIQPLINLLKFEGTLVMFGTPQTPYELSVSPLIQGRKRVAGSAGGSVKEMQEMVDLAAKHNIVADVEVISIDYANAAIERIQKADYKNRFVIDIGNTLKPS